MPTGRTFLLRNGVVLPMEGTKVRHDPGSVLVVDGRIEAVGSVDDVDRHPAAASAEVIDVTGHAVVPGFHNCHLHSGLLRGTAESLALWEWLENHVDPAHRALTPEIAESAVSVVKSALISARWSERHSSSSLVMISTRPLLNPCLAEEASTRRAKDGSFAPKHEAHGSERRNNGGPSVSPQVSQRVARCRLAMCG